MNENSLRDYFAIRIVQSFINRDLPEGQVWNKEAVAKDAYAFADVMLKVRDERE